MHAGKVAFERVTATNFKAFPSVVLWKRDAPTVQRLSNARFFLGTQFESFARDANRRPNDASAVANGACAGNLVIDILATRIDVLRKHRQSDCNAGQTGDRPTD